MGLQIPTICVFARMYVLTSEEGGRKTPIFDDYRPNHFFGELKDGSFMGKIEIADNKMVHPGETKDLWITFSNSPGLDAHLFPGNKWRINEGDRPVALAEVLRVEK